MEATRRIYHYTDSAGLLGIIKSGTIWASDARFLNDSTEISYSTEEVEDRLDSLIRREEEDPESPNLETFYGIKSMVSDRDMFPVFVSCFCKHPDLLGQWRAYGRRQGYAIGFDVDLLESSAAAKCADIHDPLKLFEVKYGRNSAEGKKLIQDGMNEIDRTYSGGFPGSSAYHEVLYTLLPLLAQIKHPSFHAEEEVRMVLCPYGGPPTGAIHFRASEFALVPYLEIGFDASSIREVIVGPGAHCEVNINGVRKLLRSSGSAYSEASVTQSGAPYRC
ncbi:DUF2971 domain-containing protein [Saccharopolyspora sp. NPDC049357]|uniref:DUF2971 domain-containing protein n=1 Tax=Saccharopolyspora sp. NPDC049357 TaxID=3154507 RepID=UPI0034395556